MRLVQDIADGQRIVGRTGREDRQKGIGVLVVVVGADVTVPGPDCGHQPFGELGPLLAEGAHGPLLALRAVAVLGPDMDRTGR
ncbi:hypothetical protein GCM10010327_40220 [Streptomyces nitrosporeus]|nr:hypothetical protein GCM10010327_40220 [Streptomyces nitrosporeus]